jgi:uncharacterized protein YbaR (Trm112 family)
MSTAQAVLRCPITGQVLVPASDETLRRLNTLILTTGVKRRDGEAVKKPLSDGLATADGQWLYALHEGIPVLLAPSAIPLVAPA